MFCNKCGANLPDGSAFCSVCGQSFANAQSTPNQAQQPQYQAPQYQQPQYQAPQYQQPQYQQPYGTAPVAPQQGMAWYKFLIYFSLFAGAVLNAISGILSMTGAQYGSDYLAELVYAYFGGLQALDIIYGLGCLALAGFAIYVRIRLAGYKSNGPKLLNILYIAGAALSLVYILGVSIIVGGEVELSYASAIGSLIGSGIMVAVNSVYFKKRAHLFIY